MSTSAAPSASRWLYGPLPDLLLGCGVLYMGFFLFATWVGSGVEGMHPSYLPALLILLVSAPHYGATLVRVYEQREERQAYVLFTLWITLALILLFVGANFVDWLGTFMVTLYLTWSPWHYSGQNFGVAMLFLRRRGVQISPTARRGLHASFVTSFLLLFLVMHSEVREQAPGLFQGAAIRLAPLGIPEGLAAVLVPLVGIVHLGLLAGSMSLLARGARLRELGPVALVLVSQALWVTLPFVARHFSWAPAEILGRDTYGYYFVWIGLGHAAQYLWVTSYYARAGRGWHGQLRYYAKVLLAGNLVWVVPVLLLAPDRVGRLSVDTGLMLLTASLVNLHHFILDGAIWKLRNSRIASVLIRSADSSGVLPEPTARPFPWMRTAVWSLAALLLMLKGYQLWETRIHIPALMERSELVEASRAYDRLAWFGFDNATARRGLGNAFFNAGQLEDAAQQFERSLELSPSLKAYVGAGRIRAQQGRLREALAHYQEAMARYPGNPGVMRQAAAVLQRLGKRAEARSLLRQAAAVSPKAKVPPRQAQQRAPIERGLRDSY